MSGAPKPGGDQADQGQAGGGGEVADAPQSGGGPRMLRADTHALVRAAGRYRVIAVGALALADGAEELAAYEPLQREEHTDDTWDNFKPNYTSGARDYAEQVRAAAIQAVAIADGLEAMAKKYAAAEYTNTQRARNIPAGQSMDAASGGLTQKQHGAVSAKEKVSQDSTNEKVPAVGLVSLMTPEEIVAHEASGGVDSAPGVVTREVYVPTQGQQGIAPAGGHVGVVERVDGDDRVALTSVRDRYAVEPDA